MSAQGRLVGSRCECAACGLRFTSVREFDRHRIGFYSSGGNETPVARRCMTVAELFAEGWQVVEGMYRQPRPQRAPSDTTHMTERAPYTGVAGPGSG